MISVVASSLMRVQLPAVAASVKLGNFTRAAATFVEGTSGKVAEPQAPKGAASATPPVHVPAPASSGAAGAALEQASPAYTQTHEAFGVERKGMQKLFY